MPRGTMNFKRVVSVVVMPTDHIACDRDPAHEGHADCPLSPHAGMSFVARYTQWTDGATRSEYLDLAGSWRAHQEGGVIPDDCFHEVRP